MGSLSPYKICGIILVIQHYLKTVLNGQLKSLAEDREIESNILYCKASLLVR